MNEKYLDFLNSKIVSKSDKKILKKMKKSEIIESFSNDLTFGTAGIRGVMGLGTSKINEYIIEKVTLGLANYLNKNYENPSVVIGYDTRNNSKKFALCAALVLNYNNITTYLFDNYASTPEVSYLVKKLKTSSGIVITSSHNSKIYNGYKVYNHLGSQIVSPEDAKILKEINKITSLDMINKEKVNNKYFKLVDNEYRNKFIKENKRCLINDTLITKYSNTLNITYTSLNGVGIMLMKKIFDEYKIKVNYVKKQCIYDGNFKTCENPNPELNEVYDLAIKTAKRNNSDIIIASDPDADRIGIMIKDKLGYRRLSGNMVGIIFTYYILNNSKLHKDHYIVRSLPTSTMVDALAKKYNVKVKEVLTGCKNIAAQKEKDEKNYLFGFEESLGYMFNIDINDKNSYSSLLFFIEILCYLKSKNMSLNDYINKIYKEVGYYYDLSENIKYDGLNSINKMNKIMDDLRNDKIIFPLYKEKIDFLNRKELKTNAIKYIFNDQTSLIIRPSGTEPKIKLYFTSFDKEPTKSLEKMESLKKRVLFALNK